MAATKEQLKELESQVVDAQEKVVNARQAMNQVNTHIALMEREKKRVDITLRELDTVGEAHQTYRSVGRMFVLTPVPQLQSDLKEKNATCGEELSKLAERKAAAQKSVDDSENHFRKTFMGYQKAHQELSGK
jgi:prefoldin subunit 1|mmetsp:Transcript_63952/g.106844  ORF Transcript_63952/g.106844 Transcript_63952/m.106844 type:complete len:132 (+) Transcript_63952:41-436(+)